MKPISLNPADARCPARLRERLGDAAPAQLTTLGNPDPLALPKTGILRSARGSVIQRRRGRGRGREARCMYSSISSASTGVFAIKSTGPLAVTTMSFSSRTAKPSSGM